MTKPSSAWKEITLGILFLTLNIYLIGQLLGGTWGTGSKAFAQPYSAGEVCVSSTECASSFCVDGFCCDQACDQPGQACNVSGQVGTCITVSTAPALSAWGQVLIVASLALAGLSLLAQDVRKRRRG
ncbi:MAG: uncharacterized protein H6Q33_1946 [Deltaproteobacteria bacterium]|nr:uncharacterized protein [Deltaproteobacteria bacterium]